MFCLIRSSNDRNVHLGEMLKHGVIERSNSPWASPTCMVPVRKDGSLRVCVYFRRLNGVTRQDAYSMPWIDELIDRLGRAKVIKTFGFVKRLLASASCS